MLRKGVGNRFAVRKYHSQREQDIRDGKHGERAVLILPGADSYCNEHYRTDKVEYPEAAAGEVQKYRNGEYYVDVSDGHHRDRLQFDASAECEKSHGDNGDIQYGTHDEIQRTIDALGSDNGAQDVKGDHQGDQSHQYCTETQDGGGPVEAGVLLIGHASHNKLNVYKTIIRKGSFRRLAPSELLF
jgi:hypothetical protein